MGEGIERQLDAKRIRERAQDRPILTRVPGRKHCALGELRPSFRVDVDAGLFGVRRTRQDDVRPMGAAIAMSADIDHKRARLDVNLVSAKIEEQVQRVRLRHRGRVEPAFARDEAEIEAAHA